MEEAKIIHHDPECYLRTEGGEVCKCGDGIEHGDDDYLAGKLEDRGYPGYPSTSQADEMMAKANDPHMYAVTHMNQVEAMKVNGQPAVWVERIAEDKITYEIQNIPNEQALRIIQTILPKVMELYLSKSRDYGGNVMDLVKLGPKASFVDLWRKVGKLKRALWDDQPMVGEQADEILADCVGHVLITLDEMKK